MSRALTSAQIIEKGDYLDPDFDPSTLTIAQLLGVFGFHNINYPSPYTKGKLVQIFNDELKSHIRQYKRERLSRQNSQASDDGIKDGITGRPINEGRRTRMTTRRSSRIPAEPVEPEPKPEPVKRRRSSAEPRLGGPSRRRTVKPSEPVLAEESEPEEPVRKVGRNKRSEEAGAEARRITQAFLDEGDSGWEDNNIFQSGAESSSPARPSPAKPRTRRGSTTLRSRKSMSVPPQFAPPSPPDESVPRVTRTTRRSSVKPPESAFDPVLPPELSRPRTRRVTRSTVEAEVVTVPDDDHEETQAPVSVDSAIDAPLNDVPTDAEEPAHEEADVEEPLVYEPAVPEDLPEAEELDALSDAVAEEDNVVAVAQRIAEGGRTVVRQPEVQPEKPPFSHLLFRVILVFALLYLGDASWNFKRESASIGFCDTGSQTNSILEGYRGHRALVAECNRENRTLLHAPINADTTASVLEPTPAPVPSSADAESDIVRSERCPPLPLVPLPRPDVCAPCPAHATCSAGSMTCENGFLLRPHALLLPFALPRNASSPHTYTLPAFSAGAVEGGAAHEAIASALDGMPGFGPVAFPPRCVENPRRKRHIGALGKAIESVLAAERGRRVCAGEGQTQKPGTEAQEAQKWGMELETLKETLKEKLRKETMGKKAPAQVETAFEDAFNEAIQQLIVWGGVFVGEDAQGKRYLAHHTPSMDLACTIKVKAREVWWEWQPQIIGLGSVIASIIAFRRRRQQHAIEDERVSELVQIALDMLRNQEIAHHTDPVTAPVPYLSSLQLRDLVLQDQHSVRARARLWTRVEAVVESNANVRTNLEEVEGGDEMRVWRWVGSAGPGTALPLSPGRTPGRAFAFSTPQKTEKRPASADSAQWD